VDLRIFTSPAGATYDDQLRVARAAEDAGYDAFSARRDAAELVRSVAQTVYVGRDDAEMTRRAAALGQEVADLNPFDLAGTVGQVVDQLGSWQSIGVTRFYLQLLDLSDIDQVELIAAEVAPQLT
jgi:alkanesulfonate monooxygenase SsuD/methylene tetrahydromethanopterin reductase-like flavin-dependent oxidoreductase (luciferase family)